MKKNITSQFVVFLKEVVRSWNLHKGEQMGAALSFYTVSSLPSLILVIFSIAGLFYKNNEWLKAEFFKIFNNNFGKETALAFDQLINSIVGTYSQSTATILGSLILFWSASLLFENIVNSFNFIWGVELKPRERIKKFLFRRLWSIVFLFFIEIILFLSLFINRFFPLLKDYLKISGGILEFLLNALHLSVVFFLPLLFFLFLFKFLADVKISWKDTFIGAFITTVLTMGGGFVLNIYFANFIDFSVFGAASTVVLILLWCYYVSQILFLGAECTYVYAQKYGSKILPSDSALLKPKNFS